MGADLWSGGILGARVLWVQGVISLLQEFLGIGELLGLL